MNKKITLVLLSIFIVAVAVGAAVAAEAKTNTQIKMLSEKTLKNGDDIEFQLKDAQGKAIASQKVNISFEANGKYENYSVMTDKDGKFYLVLTNEELGDHKVVANYYGDNKYNPSKDTNASKTHNNTDEPLYYDAEYNFYYDQWGVIVGGQNDGADAADIVQFYREQEAKGSDSLE